jgi:hypothetical protein
MIENLDARDYIGYYQIDVPRSERENDIPIIKPLTLPANNTIRVSEEVWKAVIKTNGGVNTIAEQVRKGRVKVIGSNGELSKENQNAHFESELEYSKFVNVFNIVRDAGGKDNIEFKPFVDDNSIPNFDMIRENMGNAINGEKYNAFKNRLLKELKNGLHKKSLVIPGGTNLENKQPPPKDMGEDKKSKSIDEYVELLHEKIDYLEDSDGFGNDGRPKLGKLKELGFKINKEQRNDIWNAYTEKYLNSQ